MDQSAIKEIRDLASLRDVIPAELRDRVTVAPQDVKLVDLEKYHPGRARYRGLFDTQNLAAFTAFVLARVGSGPAVPVFIHDTAYRAKAVFNLGTPESPGHADDLAALTLPRTAAFDAFLKANGTKFDQRALIEWLEDWLPNVSAIGADGMSMTMVSAIKAFRELTIAKQSEQTSQVRDFGERRSGFDEIEAKGAAELPGFLSFTCNPCLGLPIRTFRLRVGVLTTGDKPVFVLKSVAHEAEMEAVATDFAKVVSDAIGAAGVPYIGEYNA